jgi:hypothetical protein
MALEPVILLEVEDEYTVVVESQTRGRPMCYLRIERAYTALGEKLRGGIEDNGHAKRAARSYASSTGFIGGRPLPSLSG